MEEHEIVAQLIGSGELPTPDKIRAFLQKESPPAQIKTDDIRDGETSIEVLTKEPPPGRKYNVQDFVTHFRNRYDFFKNLMSSRPELNDATAISKILPNTKCSIIAMITEIKRLPTGTLKMQVEDLTGQIAVIISAKNEQLLEKAKFLSLDEVIAFKGSCGKDIFFADDIVWPNIPRKIRPKAPDEHYLVCAPDLHVGSKMFLQKSFEKFTSWLSGNYGSKKQREMGKKTKYIFVCGDIVDGVGVYPSQEKELQINDIYKQYDTAAQLLSQIPTDRHVIIIPGNHDALRICEPQHCLFKDLAAPVYELTNTTFVPNPSYIRIGKKDDFPGLNVLSYHGYSFDYYVESNEGLREAGGYNAADKIWEFLLKRRHLSPTYGATLALPFTEDPLLLRQVPDIALSGHIHKSKIGAYRGTLAISGGCFQDTTSFQQRMGHVPDPAKVPIVNLKTGRAWTLKFIKK